MLRRAERNGSDQKNEAQHEENCGRDGAEGARYRCKRCGARRPVLEGTHGDGDVGGNAAMAHAGTTEDGAASRFRVSA